MLHHLKLEKFTTLSGVTQKIELSYQLFGRELHSAPIVLVNHALTGNSHVTGDQGWWSALVGEGKRIDTNEYTILSFNVPGNGHDKFIIENYKDFVAGDIASIFLWGLAQLKIEKLFAIIGGSLGGGIAWEMAALNPKITEHLVPVASDWKSTDWLIANCQIQEQFLINSKQPVHDARMHAMLCYRTPESFKERFKRSTNEELKVFNVESWLMHHGDKLQERFQLSAYKLMNQLLKTIDVTRHGEQNFADLQDSDTNIHIIGVDSDLFFTAQENKDTYKRLAQANSNVTYGEVNSLHGHDAFLIEFEQMEQLLKPVFGKNGNGQRLKILKFGGKSLANGEGIEKVLYVIEKRAKEGENIAVVVSARGKSTDRLESLLEDAAAGRNYQEGLKAFEDYQLEAISSSAQNGRSPYNENDANNHEDNPIPQNSQGAEQDYSQKPDIRTSPAADRPIHLTAEFSALSQLLEGVALLGDYSLKIKDQVLALGELMSAKTLSALLLERNVEAQMVDARQLIKTDSHFGNASVLEPESKEGILKRFEEFEKDVVPIITGFIASDEKGNTTTLGRNGSNYSAALFANFLDAAELQNYTHVDGIFTANPEMVSDARRISNLSYGEANELANFGATILHAKTIIPLIEKNIPLRILNTFNDDNEGTLISAKTEKEGIKSLSTIENVSLINLEGRGLLGKVGIDARIFKTLERNNISVSIVSQGSSERGIGLVVDSNKAHRAKKALDEEFEGDYATQDINMITVLDEVAVISIVGEGLSTFHRPYNALIKNQVVPLLFNNTVSGKNVSLVVKKSDLNKALNVMHGQIFGFSKKVNLAIFGHGNVGGTLIDQILKSARTIEERKGIDVNIFAIANSRNLLLSRNGLSEYGWSDNGTEANEESGNEATINWRTAIEKSGKPYDMEEIFSFARDHHLENLIVVDNTASGDFTSQYLRFVENGFDLVSSNKIANTLGFDYYRSLRDKLAHNQKQYLYETNVGAGLPLIDTIKLMHLSGENITRIKGVFSGSLSYIFNIFSESDKPFSAILKDAMNYGFTEPDPREDLSGNDVGRKLLILARELDLSNEFPDIDIENLIPEKLQKGNVEDFLGQLDVLDQKFQKIKDGQKANHVLRYVGDLHGDLQKEKGILEVKLISVAKESALGQVKGSDSIIEIYTESYGEHPLVIQGAGAGAAVTARGVFGDILRIAEKG